MKCLEFKRLALSDPQASDVDFVAHAKACPECLSYVAEIRQLDTDLNKSLDTIIPADLVARLKFNSEMDDAEHALTSPREANGRPVIRRNAIAASLAVALIIGGFLLNSQFALNNQIEEDYQSLLAGVVEHMAEQPITPVWEVRRANRTVNTLLASYDAGMRLDYLDNLQFGRICPMGKYRGLHASMETENGQITFAFIKGKSLGDLEDAAYAGYVTRVKPIKGGNLIIISQNQKSLEQADEQLQNALTWEI